MKCRIFSALLLGALLLAGCSEQPAEPQKRIVYAMDTVMELNIYTDNDGEAILEEAEGYINSLEEKFSRNIDTSDIALLNKNSKAEVSDETLAVIERALKISEDSKGLFDITIAPLMNVWGFGGGVMHVPEDKEIKQALAEVDYQKIDITGNQIKLAKGMEIDLGGIAKGYTSDKLIEMFRERGVDSAIVSLGGNVQTLGCKPDGSLWKVALEDPFGSDEYAAVVEVEEKAVISAGGYERYFDEGGVRYHHILDPRSGYPSQSGLAMVTVIDDEGVRADGLATALYIMGLDRAIDFWQDRGDFEAVFITDNGNIYITPGIKDHFLCQKSFWVLSAESK